MEIAWTSATSSPLKQKTRAFSQLLRATWPWFEKMHLQAFYFS